jgi:type VI secretion system protein ImpA
MAQVEGALQDIQSVQPEVIEIAIGLAALVQKLEALIEDKTGRAADVDLKPLRGITHMLRLACQAATGTSSGEGEATSEQSGDGAVVAASSGGAIRGDINSRQDALVMLDKVIAFLERTEPGNPAGGRQLY